jgi:hypothetical protein
VSAALDITLRGHLPTITSALLILGYIILGGMLLPLTMGLLWAGDRAFRAVRRAIEGLVAR